MEQSENHNYKYMGIDALGRVIQINPDFAEEHQLAVIDCLEVCIWRFVLSSPPSLTPTVPFVLLFSTAPCFIGTDQRLQYVAPF